MSDEETERTAELRLSLAGKHSLIVVEHDMQFIEKIALKVTVLDEGRVISEDDFARSLADQYLVMERGEIIARGRGEDMDRDGVRRLLAV